LALIHRLKPGLDFRQLNLKQYPKGLIQALVSRKNSPVHRVTASPPSLAPELTPAHVLCPVTDEYVRTGKLTIDPERISDYWL